MTKFFVLLATGLAFGVISASSWADIQKITLKQSAEARLADQRLVGNVRAQAKREGVVVDVPELFVYYSDFSPAYHLSGYRNTFLEELELIIQQRRMERSMVHFGRLIERARHLDGSVVEIDQLPEADLFVVLYRTQDCSVCDEVSDALMSWADPRNDTSTWIEISLSP